MKIVKISSALRGLGLKLPEVKWKEDIVRFLVESKSERIVETPLVLGNIPSSRSVILDIGCRYSLLSIQLASLGHEMYGLDINDYKSVHPNFKFKKGDILKPPLKKKMFDLAISLSTIEHIGLGAYEEKVVEDGDVKAAKSVYSLLKNGGGFIITVPFGRAVTTKFQRVYDINRLEKLLKLFYIKKLKTFVSVKGFWQPADPSKAEMFDSSEVSNALAFVIAIKKIKS